MKIKALFILVFSVLTCTIKVSAQVLEHQSITPPDDFTTVFVHKVSEDSLSSTFIIFIKEKVAMHKHEFHSENVIVLEGTATMYLDGITYEIKPGDIIFIPKNTWHEVKVSSSIPLKVVSIQSPFFDGSDRILFKNQ